MRQENAIGLGLTAGIILAALGVTDIVREAWIGLGTPPGALIPSPVAVFSAYLVQTAVLVWITFRAYRFDHHGITAAAWVLATWEAIAMITRQNLLEMKHLQPTLYTITAFVHIVGAASLFLAMGIRAHHAHQRDRREARYAAQEYRGRRARSRTLSPREPR